MDEIGRLYDIAVETCKGKVRVGSNQLEQHTAAGITGPGPVRAASHKVDICSIYGPAGWHGYRATDAEYANYSDRFSASSNTRLRCARIRSLGTSLDRR